MAELAEYLRVGTTLLVLDCVEAGELPRPPHIRRPIRALHAICADPTLTARVPLAGGHTATGLELQRFYLEACRRFLDRRPEAPAEAREVLRRWEAVLDSLEEDPQSLVGALDWVTKQFVLEKSARRASWEARKKIDIRYHELSPQGYFQRLRTTGVVRDVLARTEIEHARRNPPAGTPAAIRGRYIREFALDDDTVAANWRAIFLSPQNGPRRVIRLDSFSAGAAESSAGGKRKRQRKGE
jgi:proteasome accessory factor A